MSFKFALAAALLVGTAAPAFAENCNAPIAPAALDGSKASKDQLGQMRDDVVKFIKASDDYQSCLYSDLKAQKLQAMKNKKQFPQSIEDTINGQVADNQRQKERVGAEFNAAVQSFKAAQGGNRG